MNPERNPQQDQTSETPYGQIPKEYEMSVGVILIDIAENKEKRTQKNIMGQLEEEWEKIVDEKERAIHKTDYCMRYINTIIKKQIEVISEVIISSREKFSQILSNETFLNDLKIYIDDILEFLKEFNEFMGTKNIEPELQQRVEEIQTLLSSNTE